jgi:hypothetical protein
MPSGASAFTDQAVPNAPVYNRFDAGPTQYKLTLEPDRSEAFDIKIYNFYNQEEAFAISLEDVDGPTATTVGSYAQYLGTGKARYGAKDWVQPEIENVTLGKGHVAIFKAQVSTPKDAEPGDYYAAMMIRRLTKPDETTTKDKKYSGSVNIDSRVAVMFYIKIKGDTKTAINISEFKTSQSWYSRAPIDILYALNNDGNISVETEGTLTIRNLINRPTESLPVAKQRVLRGTTRTNVVNWQPKKFLIGRYTAVLELKPDYGETTMEKEIAFWVIPWREMALGAVILLAVIIAFYYIRRRFIVDIKFNRIFGRKKK